MAEAAEPPEGDAPVFEPGYTRLLVGLGLGYLLVILIDRFYTLRLVDGTILFPHVGSYVFLAVLCFVLLSAAYARHVRWPSARGLTILASALGVLLYPVGTVVFIYWIGWVWRRERAA
jgi:hypothetical protein